MDKIYNVSRYSSGGLHLLSTDQPSGEWVRYSDYAALASELETVKGERDALAESIGKDRKRLVVEKTAAEAKLAGGEAVKPRLTDAMIRAACKAHFRSENADGICVTACNADWSFRDAFRRMWHGAWSALTHPAPAHNDGSGEDDSDPWWHYKINYGPDGEENYANVYAPGSVFVGNLKTYHARTIVAGMNDALLRGDAS